MHHAPDALLAPAKLTPPRASEQAPPRSLRPHPAHTAAMALRAQRSRAAQPPGQNSARPSVRTTLMSTADLPRVTRGSPQGGLPDAAHTFAARKGGGAARDTSRQATRPGRHPCSFAGSVRGTRP